MSSSNILVVSASEPGVLFPETVLRRRDQFIVSCRNGREAIQKVIDGTGQLVVFEYELGDMMAPELCRTLRDDSATKNASLLFIGERSRGDQVDLCMAAGCNEIVLRPFAFGELDRKLQKLTEIPVRRQLRTLTKVEVGAERAGHFVLGHSINISSTGMFLELDHVLPPDTPLKLQFYLHGERQPLRPSCVVVRADFSGPFPRYGLFFADLPHEDRDRIERYVVRLRARETI